jgi:glycosyltransferase involved in cell wall biosynthesis
VLVARNLEPIYDIATSLRAFARVRSELPAATMVVAGTGPDRPALDSLARELGISSAVEFAGQLDRRQMNERFAAPTSW